MVKVRELTEAEELSFYNKERIRSEYENIIKVITGLKDLLDRAEAELRFIKIRCYKTGGHDYIKGFCKYCEEEEG